MEAELLADDDGDDGEEVITVTHMNSFIHFCLLTHATTSSSNAGYHA